MTTTEMLTEEQLAEIETRARIATPPPWLVNPDPRKYVQMPFSAEEDVLRDRDANAAFCANARDDVPRLIAEIRRQRARLAAIDAATRRVEAGLDRIAEQNTELLAALAHLDAIIAAYRQPGLGPLINTVREAQEWREGVERSANPR